MTALLRTTILGLCVLAAQPVAAGATGEATEEILFRFCSGSILRMQAVESEVNTFTLALRRDADWQEYGRAIFDENRRLVRQEVPGRGALQFEPHNCEKMPGICRYTEIGLDGTRQDKMRINGREGDEWNYSLMDLADGRQELTRVGTVTYGDDGFAVKEQWTSLTNTDSQCWERLAPEELEGDTG